MTRREILEKHWSEFRLSCGFHYEPMSDKAYAAMEAAMQEYAENFSLNFCSHLNTYKGMEEARFDFMLIDFNSTLKNKP